MKSTRLCASLSCGALLVLAGCGSGGGSGGGSNAAVVFGSVYGLSEDNRLVTFELGSTDDLLTDRAITGLPAGENLVGIDFRPSTGELYALGSSSRLYRIDFKTAKATALGAGPFAPALVGSEFGFDFNPVADRVRVVSDTDENVRLHPDTGALASSDTTLAYDALDINSAANPNVVASAYTNNFTGGGSTTLYGIDSALDVLVRQGSPGGAPTSPNAGTLFTVGALGIDASDSLGFDVSEFGSAVACVTANAAVDTQIYGIDLGTGTATLVGTIAVRKVRDIALRPQAQPRVFAVTRDNDLVTFRPGAPGTILSTKRILGLQTGESVLGIDFRSSTGELYALGSTSRLYRVSTTNASAFEVGAAAFAPALLGVEFGVDFNPVVDRIRVVSDAEQNLRLHPDTGAVASNDSLIAYDVADPNFGANPALSAVAYSNNFTGAGSTTLYGIDEALDVLVTQGSPGGNPVNPNAGTLFTVGALGVDTTSGVGMDISVQGGVLASLTAAAATQSDLYSINATTGAATLIGSIAAADTVVDIAIEPPAAPRIYAVTADNRLVSFAPGAPNELISDDVITGLGAGENVLGIDFRPSTRELYALGSSSRVFTLKLSNGVATAVEATPFTPAVSGTSFGFDFNPSADRLRSVSNTTQNLRLHPDTAVVVATDTQVAYAVGDINFGAVPSLVGSAYDANFPSVGSTTLWGLDSNLDILVRQGSVGGTPSSPNSGELTTIGALGMDASTLVAFDIAGTGAAFASVQVVAAPSSELFTLDLTTGAATVIGSIGTLETIVAMAVQPLGP